MFIQSAPWLIQAIKPNILMQSRQPQLNENQYGGFAPDQSTYASYHLQAINFLKTVNKMFINQIILRIEYIGYEARNKYQINGSLGQKVFLALEESNVCTRFCLGSIRQFEMHIYDNGNNEVIRMYRHLACMCCPFWLQKLDVFCPTDLQVGYVEQEFSFLHAKFGIYDRDGSKVLQIVGPIFQCKCCGEVHYEIRNLTGKVVGSIHKHWMGLFQEIVTDAENYQLEFPVGLDVYIKMVLLGAVFLIDFMFFEDNLS